MEPRGTVGQDGKRSGERGRERSAVGNGKRILLADDHKPTRIGIRRALESQGFSVCAEAADAAEAVELACRERPDLCLLDIRMVGSGISAAKAISAGLPETPVVMLTVSTDYEDLLAALRAGASGYVLKGTDPRYLSQALQRVLDGEFALPRSLVTRAVEACRRAGGGRRFPRRRGQSGNGEWATLELLGEGLTTAEVAERLSIPRDEVRARVSALQPVA